VTAQPAVGESNSIQAVFISFSGNSLKENNVLWFCQTAHQDVLCDFLENPSSLTQMDSKQRNKECHLPPSHIPFWLELPFFFFFSKQQMSLQILAATHKKNWVDSYGRLLPVHGSGQLPPDFSSRGPACHHSVIHQPSTALQACGLCPLLAAPLMGPYGMSCFIFTPYQKWKYISCVFAEFFCVCELDGCLTLRIP
jgi:hypothetical protein